MAPYIPGDPLPESGMGGAADAGGHGKHPASAPSWIKRRHARRTLPVMQQSSGDTD